MKKHNFILFYFLIGYICSLLIVGCQSSEKDKEQKPPKEEKVATTEPEVKKEGEAKGAEEKTVTPEAGENKATSEGVPPSSTTAPASTSAPASTVAGGEKELQNVGEGSQPKEGEKNKVGEGGESTEDRLRKEEERYQRETEMNKVLAQNYLNSAKNLAKEGKYNEAYNYVLETLKLTPSDPEALKLKMLYGKELGYRDEKVSQDLTEAENLMKVKEEQARAEIQSRYEEGKRLYHNGEYEKAIRYFEGAKELIRWLPYHSVDLKGQIKQIDWYIEKCREMQKQKDAELKRKQAELAKEKAERDEEERVLTQKHRIRLLFRRANLSFERDNYDLTELLCDEILRLDPQNEQALRLKELTIQARHSKLADEQHGNYLEEWKKTMEQVDQTGIPITEIVVFPDFEAWKRVNGRGEKEHMEEKRDVSSAELAIRSKLQSEQVSLDFSETPLAQVVEFLRTTSGINMIIDPEVNKEMDEESLKVNLKVNNIKLESVLNLILSLKNLDYRIEHGVLIISTKKKVTPKPILELYNIRDLTSRLQDFPGIELSLAAPQSGGSTGQSSLQFEEAEREEKGVLSEEDLIKLIKDNIGKTTWEETGVSIDVRNGNLIVRQIPLVHQQIESLLKDLRRATGLLVTIETRFLVVWDTFLEDVGIDWRGLGAQYSNGEISEYGVQNQGALPVGGTYKTLDNVPFGTLQQPSGAGTGNTAGMAYSQSDSFDIADRVENLFDQSLGTDSFSNAGGMTYQISFLDDVELQAILRAVKKSERGSILNAPKLTAFNTQRANVSILTQQAYVRDYDVEVAQNASIADPIIGTVQDGVVLDVRPIISANQKWITLELRPALAELAQPMDIWPTGLTKGVSVTIQIPSVKLTKVQTTVTIPDGGTLLIGGQSLSEETDMTSTVPFIGDIPLLSFTGSRKGKYKNRECLLILVTAKITSMEEIEPKEGLRNP